MCILIPVVIQERFCTLNVLSVSRGKTMDKAMPGSSEGSRQLLKKESVRLVQKKKRGGGGAWHSLQSWCLLWQHDTAGKFEMTCFWGFYALQPCHTTISFKDAWWFGIKWTARQVTKRPIVKRGIQAHERWLQLHCVVLSKLLFPHTGLQVRAEQVLWGLLLHPKLPVPV